MSRVITFSRFFPKTHPKAGKPTFFVEKFWKGLQSIGYSEPCYFFSEFQGLGDVLSPGDYASALAKFHTVRAGKRFKVGDMFSPRVWSGRPYASKQIAIAPDQKIVEIYDIFFYENGEMYINDVQVSSHIIQRIIAQNDGLSPYEFFSWFKVPFEGQIICWVPVEY